MTMRNKILLAEDDHHLGNLLSDFLHSEGFAVSLCRDGEAALGLLSKMPLILACWM
ncbi:MAG: response regulator transcription factor [Bacteroidetes bacterium]|nr:response regulator transcription factor [Bacteroidota bacterium]